MSGMTLAGTDRARGLVLRAEQMTAAEIAAARARLPRAFASPPGTRAARVVGGILFAAWLGWTLWFFDVTPARLLDGIGGLLKVILLMFPPRPGEQWDDILRGMGESVGMAFLGTFVAMVAAVPLGFLGARNVLPNPLAHFGLRRVFDTFRGIDQLIWALTFVRAVGLGPLAGVLAITAAEIAVLAKLFAEAIENADRNQAEGIASVGGGGLLRLRYGIVPQVLPVMLAQFLYQFESNTRSASILGVVGAGGIGLQISERIRVGYWDQVLFIILLILATVAAIDAVSGTLRRRLIGPA